jgi:hypothetical protein
MQLETRNVGSTSVSWLVWDTKASTLHIFFKSNGDLSRFKQDAAHIVTFYPDGDVKDHVALHSAIDAATGMLGSLDTDHEHMCSSVASSGAASSGLSSDQLSSVLLVLKRAKCITMSDMAAVSGWAC